MARILVIDDEESVRKAICRVLHARGHDVAEASDGRKGLALFEKNPADVVITDIVMPEMDGLQAIREFRKIARKVKIIAISGDERFVSQDYLAFAQKLGADLTIRKPFRNRKLLDAVNHLCRADASRAE